MVPKYPGLNTREKEPKVWAKMFLSSSAADEYYKKNGRYPDEIKKLVPKYITKDIIIDDFTGKELLYERDNKGFKICSKGAKADLKTERGLDFCVKMYYK